MTDVARTRFQALVEQWRKRASLFESQAAAHAKSPVNGYGAVAGASAVWTEQCAEELSAMLIDPANTESASPMSAVRLLVEELQAVRSVVHSEFATGYVRGCHDCANKLSALLVQEAPQNKNIHELMGLSENIIVIPTCEHDYKIVAWQHHERIGAHCVKCGVLKLDEGTALVRVQEAPQEEEKTDLSRVAPLDSAEDRISAQSSTGEK